MTLDQYRIECGWSRKEMARQANIDYVTFNRAMKGDTITSNSAEKLANTISKKLGRSIIWQQIEGLNVKV
jgi:DNA-binding XRE family transcriptional regulator